MAQGVEPRRWGGRRDPPSVLTAPPMRPHKDESPASTWEDGAIVPSGPAGSGSPAPRSRHPPNDLAAMLGGDGDRGPSLQDRHVPTASLPSASSTVMAPRSGSTRT